MHCWAICFVVVKSNIAFTRFMASTFPLFTFLSIRGQTHFILIWSWLLPDGFELSQTARDDVSSLEMSPDQTIHKLFTPPLAGTCGSLETSQHYPRWWWCLKVIRQVSRWLERSCREVEVDIFLVSDKVGSGTGTARHSCIMVSETV